MNTRHCHQSDFEKREECYLTDPSSISSLFDEGTSQTPAARVLENIQQLANTGATPNLASSS
jgi:hypothetical protein